MAILQVLWGKLKLPLLLVWMGGSRRKASYLLFPTWGI
jgi:hypothetical protein